jgi:phospholipid/cholesterol/gamma-HCH transport system substrate-binding protein
VRHQPDFDDGVDEPTGKGTSRIAPSYDPAYGTAPSAGTGFEGGVAEAGLLKALLGPALGMTAADVPDLGVLLVGPMARGAEVSLR